MVREGYGFYILFVVLGLFRAGLYFLRREFKFGGGLEFYFYRRNFDWFWIAFVVLRNFVLVFEK